MADRRRKACLNECLVAGLERPHVIPERPENRGRFEAAAAGETVAVDDLVRGKDLGQFGRVNAPLQGTQWDESGPGDMAGSPFIWLTDIDQHRLAAGHRLLHAG